MEDGSIDYPSIRKAINEKTKLVTIQRSKGYQTRPTLSVTRIGELISFIKNIIAIQLKTCNTKIFVPFTKSTSFAKIRAEKIPTRFLEWG